MEKFTDTTKYKEIHMTERLKNKFNDEELKIRANSDEKITVKLTNNYAFQKIFKNTKIVKGFLMALLDLKEYEIKKIEITDPFTLGENNEEKEGILDIKLILNQNRKINIEMQNTYQEDWAERSLFYNCRMFTEGLKTGQSYSSKFQFHVIELSKLKSTKGKARKQELYRWAKLISASTWEEVREESEGNHYMEKVRDEMIKMSRDESERYLYLREQMAIRDKASQLRSAENRGRREGELLKLILQIQKKIQKNKELHQIADEVEEEVIKIQPIYEVIKEHPEADKEEIYKMLK